MTTTNLRFKHLKTECPNYGVTYWLYPTRGERVFAENRQCFGEINWRGLRAIQYLSDIDGLSLDAVRWYIRWLKRILNTTIPWRAEIVRCGEKNRLGVLWTLEKLSRKRTINLLVLTMARYIDEHFPFVQRMYKERNRARTVEDRLRLFQQIHLDYDSGVFKPRRWGSGAGNHAFSYEGGYGSSASKPISLARFRTNLKRKRSVEAYFS